MDIDSIPRYLNFISCYERIKPATEHVLALVRVRGGKEKKRKEKGTCKMRTSTEEGPRPMFNLCHSGNPPYKRREREHES